MKNYFNYFTEIEDHFNRRRGSLLLLSALDWALIETWREAEIPLAAVLRGIDDAFDRYEARQRKRRLQRINGLAWCAQAVMNAVEDMQEAAAGNRANQENMPSDSGFEQQRIAAFLERNAQALLAANLSGLARETAAEVSDRLIALAAEVRSAPPQLEELERKLTVMEEKLFAVLTATAAEEQLFALREDAAHELAPYRSRMKALQIRQIEQQFLHKRLLEQAGIPRLSLFYMSQS